MASTRRPSCGSSFAVVVGHLLSFAVLLLGLCLVALFRYWAFDELRGLVGIVLSLAAGLSSLTWVLSRRWALGLEAVALARPVCQ